MNLRITEHPTRVRARWTAPSCSLWKISLYPKIIADSFAVIADHGDARAHEAGDREHRDAGAECERGVRMPQVVKPAQRLDPRRRLCRLTVLAAEDAEVDPAAARIREQAIEHLPKGLRRLVAVSLGNGQPPRVDACLTRSLEEVSGRELSEVFDAPFEEAPLRLVARELERAPVGDASFFCSPQAAQQVGAGRVQVLVVIQRERIDDL